MDQQEHVRRQMAVMMEIIEERGHQDEQWGGPDHDDTHRLGAWCTFIGKQLNSARQVADIRLIVHNSDAEKLFGVDFKTPIEEANRIVDERRPPLVRARLVKIAALALAAIESIDRKRAKS